MANYQKNKQNKLFDGVSGTYYNNMFFIKKITISVDGNSLHVKGHGYRGKKHWNFKIDNFRNYTFCEIQIRYKYPNPNDPFYIGLLDVWRYYRLPLGYVKPILRDKI